MAIDFNPKNSLEQAIHDYNVENIIYSIVENNRLNTLAPAGFLGDKKFSNEVVFTVLLLGMTNEQLNKTNNGWFYGYLRVGERLKALIKQAIEPFPNTPTEGEKELIKAIIYHDNQDIIHLIKNKHVKFNGFAPELLLMLPELSKEATLTLLQDGISAKLKAVILAIFLNRTNHSNIIEKFSYEEKIMYTNLMIKIILGKKLSAKEPWYPEK